MDPFITLSYSMTNARIQQLLSPHATYIYSMAAAKKPSTISETGYIILVYFYMDKSKSWIAQLVKALTVSHMLFLCPGSIPSVSILFLF